MASKQRSIAPGSPGDGMNTKWPVARASLRSPASAPLHLWHLLLCSSARANGGGPAQGLGSK
eukprot:9686823-Alexandrium_andersonii.AAC.1